MTPRPPAFETAAARGPPEVRAIPARMMGYLMPRRVQMGVESRGIEEDDWGAEEDMVGSYDDDVSAWAD